MSFFSQADHTNVHDSVFNYAHTTHITQAIATIEDDAGTSGKIWSLYRVEAEKADGARIERWREGMEGLLLFAGIFSATVTAFIIEGSRVLQRTSGDATVELLTHISQQLAAITSGSQSVPLPSPDLTPFRPSSSVLRMNILWYLSLACALICALSATLVELWGRVYIQTVQQSSAARISAKTRIYLLNGVNSYHMAAVVGLIPSLMHAAVMLFMAGLIEFMFPINTVIYKLSIAVLACTASFYAVTVFLPIFCLDSPYLAPLSALIWRIVRGKRNMANTRIVVALASLDTARILAALRETVNSLVDNTSFQPFVDGIPGFLSDKAEPKEHKLAMFQLLFDANSEAIMTRIDSLLTSCLNDVTGLTRNKRVVVCMSALWSCFQDPSHSNDVWEYKPTAHLFNYSRVKEVMDAMRSSNDRIHRFATFTLAAIEHFLLLRIENFLAIPNDLVISWDRIKEFAKIIWPGELDSIYNDIHRFIANPQQEREELSKSIVEARIQLLYSVIQENYINTVHDQQSGNEFLSEPAFLDRCRNTIKLLTISSTAFLHYEFRDDMRKIQMGELSPDQIRSELDNRSYRRNRPETEPA